MGLSLFVGAYAAVASLPPDEDREPVYSTLRDNPLVAGLEVPFREPWTDDDIAVIARRLRPDQRVIVTTIPGLYFRGTADPSFGPASPDPAGRRAALDLLDRAWTDVARLDDRLGGGRIAGVNVASAPRREGWEAADSANWFAESLADLLARPTPAATVLVEHCDAPVPGRAPAKGYLDLDTELDVIDQLAGHAGPRLAVAINWGRSAIEGRSAETPLEHIRSASGRGALGAVMLSGCAPVATGYGAAWADAHAPSSSIEPASLLTPAAIAEALADAGADVLAGVKVALPRDASAAQRARLLDHELARIADAAGSASEMRSA